MMKSLVFLTLLLWLSLSVGWTQGAFKNEAEANDATKKEQQMPANMERVNLLLKLAQWNAKSDADTIAVAAAEHYALTALNISNRIKDKPGIASANLLLAQIYQFKGKYPLGIVYAKNAVSLLTLLGNMDQAGEAYVFLWSNSALAGMSYEERIPILGKAAECFHLSGNKCREADCLREQGDLYHILGQFADALNVLKRALQLSRDGHCGKLWGTYDLLGISYVALGDYRSAIQNGLMAIKLAERESTLPSVALCTYYNRLGMAYLRANDSVNATRYLEKSLDLANKCNNANSIFSLTITKSSLLLEDGKPHEALVLINDVIRRFPELKKSRTIELACFMTGAYQTMKRFDKARPYAILLEKFIAHDSTSYTHLSLGYNRLLAFYIESGDFKKAKIYSEKYRVFCDETNIPIFKSCYHIMQFMLDSASGNFLSAIGHFQHYKSIQDSLLSEAKSLQINQLSIMYETEKKDNDILLLKKGSELQNSHLKQVTLIRNITFGGVVLLVVILFLLFNGFRRKNRMNRILENQQTEIGHKNEALQKLVTEKEWLVKEIHHRVKNNLHMVEGLLASQTEFLKGDEALGAITDSQNRVYAMSLIHQKLYQTEELSSTDMPSYILDLTEHLRSTFGQALHITFRLDIAQVEFSLVYSVPIGLIINEAVTNAIKYAFPQGKGVIEIGLHRIDSKTFMLFIQDEGTGLPADFNFRDRSSLGLMLMDGLSTDIDGTFDIFNNGKGTRVEIRFADETARNDLH